ncbi:hypothetical protein HDU79_008109 [Rhizoclosmatium sp. JEL0117]|nr:hypothetical protein HDU79_008109 [Rhizoclosmatium sp. JEL0117]
MEWEAARLSHLNNLNNSIGASIGCATSTTRFAASLLCLSDIYITSIGCNNDNSNNNSQLELCPDVCDAVRANVNVVNTQCPVSNLREISTRVVNSVCLEGAHARQCAGGTEADMASCGFGGDMAAATAFCQHNAFVPSCCSTLNDSISSSRANAAVPGSAQDVSQTNESSPHQTSNLPAIIGGSIVAVFALIAAAVGLFIYRGRARRTKTLHLEPHQEAELLDSSDQDSASIMTEASTVSLFKSLTRGRTVRFSSTVSEIAGRVPSINSNANRPETDFMRLPTTNEVGMNNAVAVMPSTFDSGNTTRAVTTNLRLPTTSEATESYNTPKSSVGQVGRYFTNLFRLSTTVEAEPVQPRVQRELNKNSSTTTLNTNLTGSDTGILDRATTSFMRLPTTTEAKDSEVSGIPLKSTANRGITTNMRLPTSFKPEENRTRTGKPGILRAETNFLRLPTTFESDGNGTTSSASVGRDATSFMRLPTSFEAFDADASTTMATSSSEVGRFTTRFQRLPTSFETGSSFNTSDSPAPAAIGRDATSFMRLPTSFEPDINSDDAPSKNVGRDATSFMRLPTSFQTGSSPSEEATPSANVTRDATSFMRLPTSFETVEIDSSVSDTATISSSEVDRFTTNFQRLPTSFETGSSFDLDNAKQTQISFMRLPTSFETGDNDSPARGTVTTPGSEVDRVTTSFQRLPTSFETGSSFDPENMTSTAIGRDPTSFMRLPTSFETIVVDPSVNGSMTAPSSEVDRFATSFQRLPTTFEVDLAPTNPIDRNMTMFMRFPTTNEAGMEKNNASLLNSTFSESSGPTMLTAFINKTFTSIADYAPQRPDEIIIRVGNEIKVHDVSSDGWASGENVSTKERGWFPLIFVVAPRIK